ncbi:unnamed protein product [Lota lota]
MVNTHRRSGEEGKAAPFNSSGIRVPRRILQSTLELQSILTGSITAWSGCSSVQDSTALQRVAYWNFTPLTAGLIQQEMQNQRRLGL